MTLPGAQVAARPAARNAGVTNGSEVGAYIIAQAAKLALVYALSFAGVLNPLYAWALQTGGRLALFAVASALAVVWGALTLAVFFVSRVPLDGVPANTPRGPEIGMFALAYVIVTAAQLALSAAVLTPIYVTLGRLFATLLGLGLSIVFAGVAFALFIALRQLIRTGRAA